MRVALCVQAALKEKFDADLAAAARAAADRIAALEKAHAAELERLQAAWQAEKDALLAEIERLKALLVRPARRHAPPPLRPCSAPGGAGRCLELRV